MEDVDEVLYRWSKQGRAMSANNIPGNILMEKAKDKLEGRIKNNSAVQGHSFKAQGWATSGFNLNSEIFFWWKIYIVFYSALLA